MKSKVVLVLALAVVGLMSFAPAALAVHYYISLPRAKHIARENAEYLCEVEAACTRYGWACERAGSGATCIVTSDREGAEGDLRCESVLHLTIGAGGYIREHFGNPHCFWVE